MAISHKKFITYMVIEKLCAQLLKAMQTDIPLDDPTRADIVKIGRFQQNPIKNNVHISVSGGSLTDPELIDGIVTIKDMDKIGMNVYAREIGGGQFWWRRGEVRVETFLTQGNIPELDAAQYAYEIYGRVMNNIENVVVGGLVDDFGERAIKLFCFASAYMESGGPPSKYIWRGYVKWQFLSERK